MSRSRIALEEIRVPENVRALDDAHVQALAGSIALQGMLVPVVIRDDGVLMPATAHRRRQRHDRGRPSRMKPSSRSAAPTQAPIPISAAHRTTDLPQRRVPLHGAT
jgi:hypothetical protein